MGRFVVMLLKYDDPLLKNLRNKSTTEVNNPQLLKSSLFHFISADCTAKVALKLFKDLCTNNFHTERQVDDYTTTALTKREQFVFCGVIIVHPA